MVRFSFGLMVLSAGVATAQDWPGWMGPDRDGGLESEVALVDSIPDGGLPVLWETPIAGGYAGPSVVDGLVFVHDYEISEGVVANDPGTRAKLRGRERVHAIEADSGSIRWTHSYDCPYSISYPAGPRCTPTVDGDRVYTLGAEGDLKCLAVDNGEVVWQRSLKRDFGAEVPIWGFAAHPLVDGDRLITMVGGPGQGVVAFDKNDGRVVWKALDARAGYCPPSIETMGGTRQLIVYHPEAVVGMDPRDGAVFWSVDMAPDYDMSICRPVRDGDRLFLGGIRNEAAMIRVTSGDDGRPKAEVVWRGDNKNAVHPANSTPIFAGGVVYGTDCITGELIAVDGDNGDRLWSTFAATVPDEKRYVRHGTAFLTRIGDTDRYLLMGETGHLRMARMTREGYQDLGEQKILQPTGEAFGRPVVWSHPAYADGVAYARNDERIVAVDLRK